MPAPKPWQSIDPQMSYLKDFLDKVETEQEKIEYYKYINIFKLVKQFAIENHLIMYGGIAINELLPKTKKIYGPYDLPDYDMFSSTAKQDAIKLGKYLVSHNIQYVEVKNGIHKGTFKVFAEFKSVADITQINRNLYSYLLHESKNNPKETFSDPLLHIVPITFIKWSFHKELASPESSIYRWEKIFKRYLIFEKLHSFPKISSSLQSEYKDPIATDVLHQLNDIIKTMQYPLTGPFAINLHQSKKKPHYIADTYISSFEILSENLEDDKNYFMSLLNIPSNYKIKLVYRSSSPTHGDKYFIDILPPRIRFVLLNKSTKEQYPILTIMKVSNNCFATTKKSGYVVGTLDTILQTLYAYFMTYQFFMKGEERELTSRKVLAQIQKCNQTLNANESKTRFSSTCFGKQLTLLNVKKEMWNEKKFYYRPSEHKTPKTGRTKSAKTTNSQINENKVSETRDTKTK